jgi:hypothetical protein
LLPTSAATTSAVMRNNSSSAIYCGTVSGICHPDF